MKKEGERKDNEGERKDNEGDKDNVRSTWPPMFSKTSVFKVSFSAGKHLKIVLDAGKVILRSGCGFPRCWEGRREWLLIHQLLGNLFLIVYSRIGTDENFMRWMTSIKKEEYKEVRREEISPLKNVFEIPLLKPLCFHE